MPAGNDIKVYDDIDAHVEDLVDQERALKEQSRTDQQFTQRELNRISRDKSVHMRIKKHEFHNDPNPRVSFLEWCNDVAGLKGEGNIDRHVQAGEMLAPHKFLGGLDIGVKAICAIDAKKFNKTEMTAFNHFAITEDKPLSEQKIHVWAHQTYSKPMPPKAAQKREEDTYIDRPIQANTMEGRLALGYTGRPLLGIHLTTPPDVVIIVCKAWAQRYHPDKGATVEDTQRVLESIEMIKAK